MNSAMDKEPAEQERSFQFGIGAMLIVTAVLAVLLSVLKCLDCPKHYLVMMVVMLALELIVFAVLLVVDSAWYKHKADRDDPPEDPEP